VGVVYRVRHYNIRLHSWIDGKWGHPGKWEERDKKHENTWEGLEERERKETRI